jgi:hypothetical protein
MKRPRLPKAGIYLHEYALAVGRSLSSVKKESAAKPELFARKVEILKQGGDPEAWHRKKVQVRLADLELVLDDLLTLDQFVGGNNEVVDGILERLLDTEHPLFKIVPDEEGDKP